MRAFFFLKTPPRLYQVWGCNVCTASVVMATVLATEVIGESPYLLYTLASAHIEDQ